MSDIPRFGQVLGPFVAGVAAALPIRLGRHYFEWHFKQHRICIGYAERLNPGKHRGFRIHDNHRQNHREIGNV
jgi:hypothetical protein